MVANPDLFGFVISLSSTAVVLKLLKDWNELDTQTGQNVLVVLLAQDHGTGANDYRHQHDGRRTGRHRRAVWPSSLGAVVLIGIATWVFTRDHVRLPFAEKLRAGSRTAGVRRTDAVL